MLLVVASYLSVELVAVLFCLSEGLLGLSQAFVHIGFFCFQLLQFFLQICDLLFERSVFVHQGLLLVNRLLMLLLPFPGLFVASFLLALQLADALDQLIDLDQSVSVVFFDLFMQLKNCSYLVRFLLVPLFPQFFVGFKLAHGVVSLAAHCFDF